MPYSQVKDVFANHITGKYIYGSNHASKYLTFTVVVFRFCQTNHCV